MNSKKCSVCGATWLEGQLYWTGTQKKAKEIDLAGLVCNNLPSNKIPSCINSQRGQTGGDTWEKRMEFINNKLEEALDTNN